MSVSTKLAAAVIGGLIFVTAYTPAWAGSAIAPSAQSATAPTGDRSLVGVLSPILADAVPHQAQKSCKADSLYSQHSVVGDPDACFLSHVDMRAGAVNPGFGGVL